MKNKDKTKAELLKELEILEHRITELQKSNKQWKKSSQELKKNHLHFEQLAEKHITTLRETKDLLNKVVNLNPDWMFIKDRNYQYILVNKGYALGVGKLPEDLIGKNDIEIGFPEELIFGNPDKGITGFRSDDKRVLKGETIHNEYNPATTADGTLHIFDTYKIPLRDSNGNIYAVLGYSRDITERKQAEEAMQESENRFRELFDHMSSGVVVYETKDNGKDFIIKDFNRAAEKIDNIKKQDIIGKSVLKAFPGVKDFGLFKVFQEVYKTGKPQHHPISLYKDQRITGWRENYVYKLPSGEIVAVYDDITERKQAEDEKHREKLLSDSIIDNMPAGISFLDNDFVLRRFNRVTDELIRTYTPYTGEQALGMSYFDYAVGSRPQVEEWFQKVRDTGQVDTRYGFNLVLEKDGLKKTTYWDTSVAPVLGLDGKVKGIIILTQDVTERKQAEDKLLKNQYYLTKAQEIGIIGTWERDIQKNILIWTDENYKIFGVPLGTEMNYESFLNCVHPDDRDYVNEKWSSGLNHEPYDIEHRIIVNDKVKWVKEKADIEFDTEGNPIMAIGVTQDITKHKQAEETLRASEERYFNLFDNANDLIQIVNPAGKILAVNKKWLATLEYSPEDVKGLRVTDIIREDKIPQISGKLQEVAVGRSVSFETIFISKSGKEINVEGRGNGIFKDGKLVSAVGIFRDITERKQAEENVKNARDELQMIMDSVPAIIFHKDIEGRIIRVNKTLADSLKIPLKDIVGKTTEELFPKEQAENMRKDDKEVIVSGKPKRDIIQPYTTPDGIRLLISDKLPYKDKEGKITGVIGLAKDITERKQAEEALQFSEERLRSITKNTLDYIMLASQDMKIQFFNKTIPGLKKEDIIGRSITDIAPKDFQKLVYDRFQSVLKTGKPANYQLEYLTAKGKTNYFDVRLSPIIREGKVVSVIINSNNVTERKKDEEKIQKLNKGLNLLLKQRTKELIKEQNYTNYLLEFSPDFQITLDGEGKILGVNRAFEEVIGKKREKLIGSFIYEFISKEAIKKVRDKIFKEKMLKNIEITINVPKKEPLVCDFSGAVFANIEGKDGIYLSGRDITERRRLQQNLKELSENLEKKVSKRTKELREAHDQLIQSEKLSTIGQLAANIAHEIRNPLTTISLTIEHLARKYHSDFQKVKVQTLKKNTNRIDKIVQGLLTFSRPGSSNFAYEDINEMLYKLEPTLKNVYQKKINITKNYNATIPKLWINSQRLEQVFINITLNAIQAMKEGDKLYISTDFDSKRNGILIKFKDTGCGIAEEDLKKIFNPFFTTREDGTGLGLSICQMIIDECKGNISVESKIGKETVFTVFLPLEKRR